MFTLHPTLIADTLDIGELSLCKVLLSNDQRFPWIILVPKRANIRELFELNAEDQQRLWAETTWVAEQLNQHSGADKMNVATLGNMVPQLHMHVVVRHQNDAAWPSPIWGSGPAIPYESADIATLKNTLSKLLINNKHPI